MSEGDSPKPTAKLPLRVEEPPFAYRALCRIAGVVAVVSVLPGLLAAIAGFFALMTRPSTPAWAYVNLAFIGGVSVVMLGNGMKVYRGRVLAAAVTGGLFAYFTAFNLQNGRLVAAAFASLSAVLCLAIVIAAWRIRRAAHAVDDEGETT